jgi:hypothetical protein
MLFLRSPNPTNVSPGAAPEWKGEFFDHARFVIHNRGRLKDRPLPAATGRGFPSTDCFSWTLPFSTPGVRGGP